MPTIRNILVTGCSGLIGKTVCQALLKKNMRVVGIDTTNSSIPSSEEFTFINCPANSNSVVSGILKEYKIDGIVHLAYTIDNDLRYILDKSDLQPSSVCDKQLFKTAVEYGIKDIILLSTHKVYPPITTREPINELVEEGPLTYYGKMKYESEKALIKALSKASMTQGVIMRTCPVYSEEFTENLRAKIFDARSGIPFLYGYGDYGYSFTHVKNISDFVCSILEIGKGMNYQGIYNICDTKPITAREIVEYEKKMGRIAGIVDQREYSSEKVKSKVKFAFFKDLNSISEEERKDYRFNDTQIAISNISYDNKKAQRICPMKRKFSDLLK